MAKRRPDGPTGFAIIDKPRGWTSHDVVAKARGVFGTRKVGHSGTLDPDATGVLLLGVGKATRILRFLDGAVKSYTGDIVFGSETNSLDSTGEVTATHEMDPIDLHAARTAAEHLTGEILQVPPMVSAKKVDGKRLHELAREGIEIERKAVPGHACIGSRSRRLTTPWSCGQPSTVLPAPTSVCSPPILVQRSGAVPIFTDCSRGPRLGRLLKNTPPISSRLFWLRRPSRSAISTPCTVDADIARDIAYGKVLPLSAVLGPERDQPYPVLSENGDLLAVYERHRGNTVKPSVVLAEPPPPTPSEPERDCLVKIIRDSDETKVAASVVTIGAFDGVHVGHQTVIREVMAHAGDELGVESTVVTFDVHPALVVRPESAPLMLTTLDRKLELTRRTRRRQRVHHRIRHRSGDHVGRSVCRRSLRRSSGREADRGWQRFSLRQGPGRERSTSLRERGSALWVSRSMASSSSEPMSMQPIMSRQRRFSRALGGGRRRNRKRDVGSHV